MNKVQLFLSSFIVGLLLLSSTDSFAMYQWAVKHHKAIVKGAVLGGAFGLTSWLFREPIKDYVSKTASSAVSLIKEHPGKVGLATGLCALGLGGYYYKKLFNRNRISGCEEIASNLKSILQTLEQPQQTEMGMKLKQKESLKQLIVILIDRIEGKLDHDNFKETLNKGWYGGDCPYNNFVANGGHYYFGKHVGSVRMHEIGKRFGIRRFGIKLPYFAIEDHDFIQEIGNSIIEKWDTGEYELQPELKFEFEFQYEYVKKDEGNEEG